MSTTTDRLPVRIGGFVAVLAVLFGAAFGIGRYFDQEAPAPTAASYELRLERASVPTGAEQPIRFSIVDQDGRAVTEFDVQHEKPLHLIAVRSDFNGFQHVHPTMTPDGTWTTTLATSRGSYRLFADFQAAGGEPTVAHADLSVEGSEPGSTSPPPPVTRTATVDGYQVTLEGDLAPEGGSTLTLAVERDGKAVTDLEPYLGAYGHLVVLRGTDQRYLHVHPEDGPPGPGITFHVEAPTEGRYHLYLDFQHGGEVRTAQFALDTTQDAAGEDEHGGDHGDDH